MLHKIGFRCRTLVRVIRGFETCSKANEGVITQINVFTVAPENQQRLIDSLIETASFTCDEPGWLSASIHRSLDGTRVVNYAQSESYEACERIMKKLQEGGYMQKNKEFVVAAPGLYEVVYTLDK